MEIEQNTTATWPADQSLGSILRRCRENLDISIEKAAEETKIRKAYLIAMEEGNLQILPSQSYYRGFLRTYSNYLGLDTERLIRFSETEKNTCFETPASSSETNIRQGIFPWQQMIMPAVLLAGIIISTMFVQTDQPQPARRPEPARPAPVTVTSVQQLPVQQQSSSAKAAPAAQEQPVTTEPSLPQEQPAATQTPPQPMPSGSFLVRMKVTRNSSLTVTIDESTSQLYELTSGDLIEWKAGKTVAMDISDAGSVELELNGKPVKLESVSGSSTYIVLDANGIQR